MSTHVRSSIYKYILDKVIIRTYSLTRFISRSQYTFIHKTQLLHSETNAHKKQDISRTYARGQGHIDPKHFVTPKYKHTLNLGFLPEIM